MKTFDKNIPLDVELKKLLGSFYGYIDIRINVAPSDYRCPVCDNDIHFGCIRFSKNTCFYSDKMEKDYGKLEDKLHIWLKTNDKNRYKIKSLKEKVQDVFKDLESKWICDKEFKNKFPYEVMKVLEGEPEMDENGYHIGLKTIEVEREQPYEHYKYLLLYREFKEKCYLKANKVENLISVRLQDITLPKGFNTRWNEADIKDFEPAYNVLKNNGFIVDGSLEDFYNILSNKRLSNIIEWKPRGMSYLAYLLKQLVNDPTKPYIKDQHYRKKAQDYFFIEGQPISTSSFDGSKKPAKTDVIDKTINLLTKIS